MSIKRIGAELIDELILHFHHEGPIGLGTLVGRTLSQLRRDNERLVAALRDCHTTLLQLGKEHHREAVDAAMLLAEIARDSAGGGET